MYPLITIPTRGRVSQQTTLQNLPLEVHKHVVLVCPADERKMLREAYPTVRVMAQPAAVTTISQKRAWIMTKMFKQFDQYRYCWMLDDDLNFSVFLPKLNAHRTVSKYPKASKKFWLRTFPKLCREYRVAGLGTKFFALKGGVRENYHLGFAFGMHKSVVGQIKWNRIAFYEDIDYTLQFLRKGIRIGLSYDMVVQQRAAEAEGGLTGERTNELVEQSLEQLIEFHPEFVKKKEASGAHFMSNTRISWAKAAKAGGL